MSTPLAGELARLDLLIDWERRDRSGPLQSMRVDLAAAADLCARLGHPERAFRAVHVAGTKGKGSVCALVAEALRASGVSTARYASPHVERIHERVVIDGREVEGEELARHLRAALDAREEALREGTAARDATWFDVLTAAAFRAFSAAAVEWAVVECGLGGRLDSTNVVRGEVCVVTNVDREHVEVLGPTRARIAREKGGIVEPGSVLVTGVPPPPDEAGVELEAIAAERGARLVRVVLDPAGPIDSANLALARVVLLELERLGVGRPRAGLAALVDVPSLRERARLPGRGERANLGGVPVVLDGAHVPSSLERLLAELACAPELARPATVVLGLGRDKDAGGMLKVLQARADRLLCTSAGGRPHFSPEELADKAREVGLVAETASPPRVALRRALEHARPDGWILVTGSLHLVGELRPAVRSPDEGPPCSRSSPTSS